MVQVCSWKPTCIKVDTERDSVDPKVILSDGEITHLITLSKLKHSQEV